MRSQVLAGSSTVGEVFGSLGGRKARLAKLLSRKTGGILFKEHTDKDGATVFRHACKLDSRGLCRSG
jgi:hypothetical protein